MKRWRCPDCGAVHTVRPHTHWRRFLAPWWLIVAGLVQKVVHGRWLSLAGRQRQQYWRVGYLKQRQASGGLAGVMELVEAGIVAATHSLTDRWSPLPEGTPHRRLAATGSAESG